MDDIDYFNFFKSLLNRYQIQLFEKDQSESGNSKP